MTIGIYAIVHKKTLKAYVGSSKHIELRYEQHKVKCTNRHLKFAIDKYGLDAFELIILEECSLDKLQELEDGWLITLKRIGWLLYNLADSAKRINPGIPIKEWLGEEQAKEFSRKVSESLMGRTCKQSTRDKISVAIEAQWQNTDFKTQRSRAIKESLKNVDYSHTVYSLSKAREKWSDTTIYCLMDKLGDLVIGTRKQLNLPGMFGRHRNNFAGVNSILGLKLLACPLTCPMSKDYRNRKE